MTSYNVSTAIPAIKRLLLGGMLGAISVVIIMVLYESLHGHSSVFITDIPKLVAAHSTLKAPNKEDPISISDHVPESGRWSVVAQTKRKSWSLFEIEDKKADRTLAEGAFKHLIALKTKHLSMPKSTMSDSDPPEKIALGWGRRGIGYLNVEMGLLLAMKAPEGDGKPLKIVNVNASVTCESEDLTIWWRSNTVCNRNS